MNNSDYFLEKAVTFIYNINSEKFAVIPLMVDNLYGGIIQVVHKDGIMLSRLYNSVAALIVRNRNMRGWKQKDLADRIGLSTSLVGRWETGDVVPTPRDAELVAEALGIDKETIAMRTFLDRIAESRRKATRNILREYASYPQVLKIAERIMSCPNCSNIIGGLENSRGIDMSSLEPALDGLEAGIYIRDIEGKILHVNEYLAKMLRTDRKSLLRCNIRAFDANTGQTEGYTKQIMAMGVYTGKTEIIGPNNARTAVVTQCYLIKNAYGDPVYIIGLVYTLDAYKEMVNHLFKGTSMIFDVAEEIS